MKIKLWTVLLVLMATLYIPLSASSKNGAPSGDIPPFKILKTTGTYFSATDLPKGKSIILIYFSPDCEHCEVLMNEVFKRIAEFKNTELVMVTFKPLTELADFEKKYSTFKYPNIITGTEGTTFFLRMYYKIMNTPFTALYDKNGKLVYTYRNKTPVDDILKRVKSIPK